MHYSPEVGLWSWKLDYGVTWDASGGNPKSKRLDPIEEKISSKLADGIVL